VSFERCSFAFLFALSLTFSRCLFAEPELFGGYNPKKKGLTQEIELQHDLEPIEASQEDADRFKLEHGEKVDIFTDDGSKYYVKFKKGAKIIVPKAVAFDRLVAGQSESLSLSVSSPSPSSC